MEIFDMQEMILDQILEIHENILKEVLRQILKREPVIEDAKRLTRYEYEGVFDYYDLAFDNVKIGRVITSGNKNYKITFEPA